ncbi:hypothetical protein B0H17DRAFT_212645 [Mycena rosella]|uniref:RING-type domain-containing protein n=1 Tax=Mycena rosella TaxID=1033263 RepID=A0AAD7GQ89_MYCRO|nr:hypothetical protein B0H17DRAFT_212645 [Mycena rosella]
MSAKVRCDVCFESYTLDMFRFLPSCGHGLCIVCSEKTVSKPKCVICRHPKGSQESIQIFLTFGESSPADKAHAVVDNLARIGTDSMPISVQKAGRKIRHAMRDIEPGDDVARELLDAAKNLDERIYPLFLELDLANDKILALTTEIEVLRQQLRAAEAREDEIKRLRRSVAKANNDYKAALSVAEKTKDVALKERAESARLGHAVQRQLSELSAKDEQITVLRAKLTRRENRVSLLEKKLKVVSRAAKHPKTENDPDESLQIDHSAEVRVHR